jgi:hypothetical protein
MDEARQELLCEDGGPQRRDADGEVLDGDGASLELGVLPPLLLYRYLEKTVRSAPARH